jgi:tRNA (guanine6-N2)-methyltransferase
MTPIFALTTRGLEPVSAREMASLPGVTITETAYRRVAADCTDSLVPLLGLRTVDDVYLDVGTWPEIGRPRSTLAALRAHSIKLDLREAAALIAEVRQVLAPPIFSVTASFVGKRNYNTEEIKQAVADGIATRHGWEYQADDRQADLNLRVFIEHEVAFVGVRLAQRPLHERSYKQTHRAGSLKPSVAAAMVMLADMQLGMRLLDPCCGTGTILIEAALQGAVAQGGDNDADAVAAARANIEAAGVEARVEQWNAQALPLADASVDCVVSNLPWGRQVEVDEAFYRRAVAEMRRVLVPGGRLVLLTDAPQLLDLPNAETIEISLFGQTPTIVIAKG